MNKLLLLAFIIASCSTTTPERVQNHTEKKIIDTKITACTTSYDSVLLKYAKEFKPKTIDLEKSLSPDVRRFLLTANIQCLRQQNEYQIFIATILAKLYLYHLKCCNQGYDLQSTNDSGAKVIIDEFKHMCGYDKKRLEMLNSGAIVFYIEKNEVLKSNYEIKKLIEYIKSEQARIEKGYI